MIQVGIQKARLPPLPDAPAALQGLVDRCTAAEPAARPSFADIEAALAQLAAGLPGAPLAGGSGALGGPMQRSKSAGHPAGRAAWPALGTLGEGTGL